MGNEASVPRSGTRLQVIGAGLPRTGTASFSEALRILLNGPVYHGGTQCTRGSSEEILDWIEAIPLTRRPDVDRSVAPTPPAISAVLKRRLDGFAAATDSPICGFFPEILELYPDAMVICTTRDPTSWTRSMDHVASASTAWFLRVVLFPLPAVRHFPDYINALRVQWLTLYGQTEPVDEDVYHQHVEWLKMTVPKDKLLFFDVKEGWEPLCKALGKDVPDAPFPRINDSEAIERLSKELVLKGLRRWGIIIGVLATVAGAVWWL